MIQVYNRTTKAYEEELIAGKKYIEWTYESPLGKNITELIAKKKLFSKIYRSNFLFKAASTGVVRKTSPSAPSLMIRIFLS